MRSRMRACAYPNNDCCSRRGPRSRRLPRRCRRRPSRPPGPRACHRARRCACAHAHMLFLCGRPIRHMLFLCGRPIRHVQTRIRRGTGVQVPPHAARAHGRAALVARVRGGASAGVDGAGRDTERARELRGDAVAGARAHGGIHSRMRSYAYSNAVARLSQAGGVVGKGGGGAGQTPGQTGKRVA